MNTEQEISGAERETRAFRYESEVMLDEQRQRADVAEASQHSTRVLLEEEEAENEDNRRILSMAEEREKKLREALERIGLKAALITADDDVTDSLLVRITAIHEEARSAVRNA